MIRITTVHCERYLIEPNGLYSNAEEFAKIIFHNNGIIHVAYVISTTGVIISTKHIVTVEDIEYV